MTEYDDYGIPVGAFVEPEDFRGQAWRTARAFYFYRVRPLLRHSYNAVRHADWSFRRWFTLANVLVVAWWVVLYWGEKGTFDSSLERCHWDRWENWESGANPHRLVFVADPQLIDPHTYPGRPWPLNPLAYKYTDLYLRRTYSRLQTVLYPDTVFFLGDLFDGGREWATRTTRSPEERYRRYGDDFWINEYKRFGNIFFRHWGDAGMEPRPGQPGRKIISSLPGNHDLGFARGVQVGVRKRFNAYFGDGNRIDVIANHTFVSIDSLSLSALGQDSPGQVEELWRPTTDFLEKAKTQKKRLVQRELRRQQGLPPYPGFAHYDIKTEDLAKAQLPHSQDDVTEFPTILLSHIPLYRAPGTPCGPLREHWPPTPPPAGQPPLDKDDRNAISVSGGYQYQNVLNKEITVDIANKIGNIAYAFSGDDHDYCAVRHRSYASAGAGIAEITVKSTSWAMGVRRPAVVLASLWNPVDPAGNPLAAPPARPTLQTHLCLFPDQIATFIRYALFFALTLVLLGVRASLVATRVFKPYVSPRQSSLLPVSHTRDKAGRDLEDDPLGDSSLSHAHAHSHTSHASTSSQHGFLLARAKTAKYTYPLVQHAGTYAVPERDKDKVDGVRVYGRRVDKERVRNGWGVWRDEVRWTLGKVLVLGGMWYAWLVWGDRM